MVLRIYLAQVLGKKMMAVSIKPMATILWLPRLIRKIFFMGIYMGRLNNSSLI